MKDSKTNPMRFLWPLFGAFLILSARTACSQVRTLLARPLDLLGGATLDQTEPSIAIDPTNPNNICVGANISSAGVEPAVDMFFSTDQGRTFSGPTAVPYANADPAVAFDKHGNAFVAYNRKYGPPTWCGGNGGCGVARSTDHGVTWNPCGQICPTNFQSTDKPCIAIDLTNDFIYVAWTETDIVGHDANGDVTYRSIHCAKSTDQGATFAVFPQQINPVTNGLSFSGMGVALSVGPDGMLFAAWGVNANAFERSNDPNDPATNDGSQGDVHVKHIAVNVLRSGRSNFEGPVRVAAVDQSGYLYEYYYHIADYLGRTAAKGLVVNSFPSMAVDQSTTTSHYVYIVWANATSTNASNVYSLTYASTDGGVTFAPSSPSPVISDLSNNQWLPWACVSPNDGGVNVVYYTRMHDVVSASYPTRVCMTRSLDHGGHYSNPPKVLSRQTFLPTTIWSHDYIGIAAADNLIIPVWAENTSGDPNLPGPTYLLWTSLGQVTVDVGTQASATFDQQDLGGTRIGGSAVRRWDLLYPSFDEYTVPYAYGTTDESVAMDASHSTFAGKKFNRWAMRIDDAQQIDPYQDVRSLQVFDMSDVWSPTYIAQFKPFYTNATLQASYCDRRELIGGQIGFKDPWLNDFADPLYGYDLHNLGTFAPYRTLASPFRYSAYSGPIPYQGFFLGEANPVYALQASALLHPDMSPKVGAMLQGDWYLTGIDGINATTSAFDGSKASIVFNSDNAIVTANYKAHLATGNAAGQINAIQAAALPSNSQRAIVTFQGYDPAHAWVVRFNAMAYLDNGMLLFTYSNDAGLTWATEQRLDGAWGDPGHVRSASISVRSDMHVGVVWEDGTGPSNGTSAEPVIRLQDLVPVVGIADGETVPQVVGFTGRFSPVNTFPGNPYTGTMELYGSNPVVAPYLSAQGTAWWVGWVHAVRLTNSDAPRTAALPVGVYVVLADRNNIVNIDYDYTGVAAPDNFVIGSTCNGSIAEHLSASASFIDAPFPPQAAPGNGNTADPFGFGDTPSPAMGVLNSFEGAQLHLMWDLGGKVWYTQKQASFPNVGSGGNVPEVASTLTAARTSITALPGSGGSRRVWVNSCAKPSLAVDDYDTTAGSNVRWEEPIMACEFAGAQAFLGPIVSMYQPSTNTWGLSFYGWFLDGIMTNRRGRNPSQAPWANKYDPRQFPQLFVATTESGSHLDHPSVAGFPLDCKANMPLTREKYDLQAALAFHAYLLNNPGSCNGDQTVLGYTYSTIPNPVVPLGVWNIGIPSCGVANGTLTAPWTGRGTVEPHLGYGKYGMTPSYTGRLK